MFFNAFPIKLHAKLKIGLIQLIMACIFTYFYAQLVPCFPLEEFDKKFRGVEDHLSLIFPIKTTYLLKVWGGDKPAEVSFNKESLTHFFYRDRGEIQEFYYVLSKNKIHEGKNIIKITSNIDYSVRIKNSINFNNFSAVLLKPIPECKDPRFLKLLPVFLLLLIFLLSTWLGYFFIARKFFGLSFEKYGLGYVLTFFPAFLFFSLAKAVSLFTSFAIIIFQIGFIEVFVGLVLMIQLVWFAMILLEKFSNQKNIVGNSVFTLKNHILKTQNLPIDKFKKIFKKYPVVLWFMSQSFSDKSIIIFLFTIFFSSFFLVIHIKILAEFFAAIGFLFLLYAVIIKISQ